MPAWLAPAIAASATFVENALQRRANRKEQERMNEYNSPKNQMARYQEAGLNPNLVYGQGTPGNQPSPTEVPFTGVTASALQAYNQTRMVSAQVSAQNAKTIKTQVDTEVAQTQKRLLEANPLLNNEGFKATMDILRSTAQLRMNEATISEAQTAALMETGGKRRDKDGMPTHYTRAAEKVIQEVELLNQRFDLNTSDQKIKAEVLSGKAFQNAILEVQKKFMTDFELTPQNWLQFVQLLIQKF